MVTVETFPELMVSALTASVVVLRLLSARVLSWLGLLSAQRLVRLRVLFSVE